MAEPLTVPQAIESRRSRRRYTPEEIPNDMIRELIRLAGLAPSPNNLQPWRIIAVKNSEMKRRLMEAANNQPQVGGSAVTFVLYTDMNDVLDRVEETVHPGMKDRLAEQSKSIRETFARFDDMERQWWGRGHAYTFMGFLMLAAESMGYATSGMLGFDRDKVKALFGIPEHAQIAALVAMGRPDDDGFVHHRHPVERILTLIE